MNFIGNANDITAALVSTSTGIPAMVGSFVSLIAGLAVLKWLFRIKARAGA